MAGHVFNDDSFEEDYSPLHNILLDLENLIFPNHILIDSSSPSTPSSTNDARNALITDPPIPLELRQNNPQDCSNLISASVNRATVEISRTIIALNATFSQQLQQASISASNSIKSAQGSASSTIDIVVKSASVATSSAFSSVTVANLIATSANSALTSVQLSASTAMSVANSSLADASSSLTLANLALTSAQSTITNVNLALTSVSSASSSDVARLSSSLSILQSSVLSVQSSASAAIAAAQVVLASATGSATAQASSILASAASATAPVQTISIGSNQSPPTLQVPPIFSLSPAQAAAIVIGAVVASVLFSFGIYFLVKRIKRRNEIDSYLDEKSFASSPRNLPSRMSPTLRTGNAMTIKFSPPKSSDAPPPDKPTLRRHLDFPIECSGPSKRDSSKTISSEVDGSPSGSSSNPPRTAPPTSNFSKGRSIPASRPLSSLLGAWPLIFDAADEHIAPQRGVSSPEPTWPFQNQSPNTNIIEQSQPSDPVPITKSEAFIFEELPENPIVADPSGDPFINQYTEPISEPIENPFEDPAAEEFKVPFEKKIVGPSQEGIDEVVEKDIRVSVENSMEDLVEEHTETSTPQKLVDDELLVQPPTKTLPKPLEEPIEEILEQPIGQLPKPFPLQAEPGIQQRLDDMALEQLLPQQPKKIPAPETLALLREDEQPRNSAVPEIDKLLRIVARQNEVMRNKPLFWSDFRAPDPEVEMAMPDPLSREPLPPREALGPPPEILLVDALVNLEQRDRTLSPLRRNPIDIVPVVEPLEASELFSPKSPPLVATEPRDRTLSPLRRNPVNDFPVPEPEAAELPLPNPPDSPPYIAAEQKATLPQDLSAHNMGLSPFGPNGRIRNITSLLAENETDFSFEKPTGEITENGDREERGRSMIRTSDIIEARLSGLVLANEKRKAVEEEKERTVSPLRRNPVDSTQIPVDQRDRTLSPLRRNPSSFSIKRKSRTLSPLRITNTPLKLVPTPNISREDSPLRRNPLQRNASAAPGTGPKTSTAAENSIRPASNVKFSQKLSKFQTLASQNQNDGIAATNEVTQRAIAGIYIPGSLREQAVRNLRSLSKSRERGESTVRRVGSGALSRSASQPGGR
ncbi:hypothetical protein G7Y89_g8435 [Cudoniella acicularis]|uniref:Uncharacterized protein n=1 Tax=Cudoniella acicularis TaxID=354080 RepID=A0A8H4W127_9HELO|nr:hypothetical protein G7Y89_g8435 [Cudoniella acicularis]